MPSAVLPAGLGVATHFTDPAPGEMERMAEAGWAMIRTDLIWQAVERTPGHYDFAAYDRLQAQLKHAGIRPMFILDYGNRLYDGGRSPHTAQARAAFARFAAAAAAHFRGQGVVWEIWNEPNIVQFWKPEPDAQAYARLAMETAQAIREADPEALILRLALPNFPGSTSKPSSPPACWTGSMAFRCTLIADRLPRRPWRITGACVPSSRGTPRQPGACCRLSPRSGVTPRQKAS